MRLHLPAVGTIAARLAAALVISAMPAFPSLPGAAQAAATNDPAGADADASSRLAAEPTFDIGLATDTDTLRIEPQRSVQLSWRSPGGAERSAELDEPFVIRLSGVQALVEPRGHARAVPLAVLESADTLWIGESSLEKGDEARLAWNGRHWRGRFKVFFGPRGRLALATRLPLERYLLGVVPGEIGALRDSLVEAGRAQAIAARSYSLFYKGRRATEGFDLYGTVEDQLYGPAENERPLATRCVETTRGRVSVAGGGPIRANYCSTCGGVTAEAWEAWPTEPRSYLRSVADRGVGEGDHCALSPQYRWREEWSVAEFAANLARFAPAQNVALPPAGVGEIRDVEVAQRSRSGRVWRLVVTTSTGTIGIPAYSLRQLLRRPGNVAAILRSNLFKIAVRRGPDGRALSVVASGAGSGHGVGLCQTGALAMARGGASAADILAHYYAGSKIQTIY